MTTPGKPTQFRDSLLNDVYAISKDDGRFKMWEYFSGHAAEVKERLWSTGTWLIGLQLGLLVYIMSQGFATFGDFWLKIEKPHLTGFASAIGFFLCLYSALVIYDQVKHIHDNWNRANDLLGKLNDAQSPLWIPGIFILFLFVMVLMLAYIILFVSSVG